MEPEKRIKINDKILPKMLGNDEAKCSFLIPVKPLIPIHIFIYLYLDMNIYECTLFDLK